MKKIKRKFEPHNHAIELTICGDSNEYGAIVWFGTDKKSLAEKRMHRVARSLSSIKVKDFPKSGKLK